MLLAIFEYFWAIFQSFDLVTLHIIFSDQLDYAFQESGLSQVINEAATKIKLPHLNLTSGHKSTRAKDFFSKLTKQQVKELYFKFRIDFELFDYSIEPYLYYAKDSEK